MSSRFRGGAFAAVSVFACSAIPQAFAADVIATIPIDKVTVYRDSAIVTRAGVVEVPAGDHRLILRNLPGGLDPATLRLTARAPNARLGGIEVQRMTQDEAVNDSERALNKKMRAIGDQKAAIEDDVAAAQSQLKLLESVVDKSNTGPRIAGPELNALVTSVGSSDAAARTRIRNARLQLRELDEQLEVLKADLQKVATTRKSTTELRATVHVEGDTHVPVELEYQMAGAGWQWQYEARLDSQSKKVSLARQSEVRQGTGEDWKNVELVVSTSRPSMNTSTPRIAALFLGLRYPSQAASAGGGSEELEEIVVTGVRRGGSRRYTPMRSSSSSPAAPPKITADVFATDFVADYRIPGRVSVVSDREARLYPIGDDDFTVDLVARVNMTVAPTAYLEGKLTYQGKIPIDAGKVQLYRDDAFIGVAGLPLVLPGDEVRLPFGIDERVRIAVRDEREESGDRGIINKQQVDQRKRRFEVTSFHANTLPIEVIDRVPVPRHEDVRVEVLEGATPPTVKDLDGMQGVYLWRLPGTPRKTETIRHYYVIRFPKDMELTPIESP